MIDPDIFARRERDWRNGGIVYQVLVDRFAPSENLEAKRGLYKPPKVLRDWSETPKTGVYLRDQKLASHELDFWGGDFASLSAHLDYIEELGADVLYLNPIHLAYTNHKYDALDFQQISPEFGTREDFNSLVGEVHRRGMKLVLDGVFNHMGRNSAAFQDAQANPASPWRDWFVFGEQFPGGARSWTGFQNLPELNLENPAVRDYIYNAPDSVVRGYLRDGADGWRLDTAYELGYGLLRELTEAAHAEKPASLVIGEIVNYPDRWLESLDAVMGFTLRHIILGFASGQFSPAGTAHMLERLVCDCGIEPLLKSWTLIDNHDIPRIAYQIPETPLRRLVQALQFTLPGSPNIYYGSELGMNGGPDPENREPMRWDLAHPANPELSWIKRLISLRKEQRALRIGDFRLAEAERLLAFERVTERTLETVVVLANPSGAPVSERVLLANAGLMDATTHLFDLLSPPGSDPVCSLQASFISVTVPAETVYVLAPREQPLAGYSRYKRIE